MIKDNNIFLDHPYILSGRHIDPINGAVNFKSENKKIRRKELEVLAQLISADHGVVSRDEFIEALWSHNAIVGEKGLTRVISDLRNTLSDDDKSNPIIRTIPRQGYQLNSSVKVQKSELKQQLSVDYILQEQPEWRLIDLLASTGFSETWKVQTENGVLKELRFCLKSEDKHRILYEFKLLSYLKETVQHTNLIMFDEVQLDHLPNYLVLPCTTHGSLANWVKKSSGLSAINEFKKTALLIEWAEALATVHAVGVVHRNLSPNTLYIGEKNGDFQAQIGDFGMAILNQTMTSEQWNLGEGLDFPLDRSEYLAPELLAEGLFSQSSDVYALGVLMFKVLVGDLQLKFDQDWMNHIQATEWQDLIKGCIDQTAVKRTKSAKIVNHLKLFLNKQQEKRSQLIGTVPEKIERQVGPFKLLEKIGEGGMGVVYLAEQFHPVERQVALKLLKEEMETDMALARFRAESQALAMMNHVNVASIFETGSLDSGLPYFVMEYVEGQAITEYCDAAQLNIHERALLFLQFCDGLLHAHQKSIIHRDINPSNIIVKNEPNVGHLVKIIDFGVAKSMQKKLSNLTLHTQAGEFVGTPQYSSPEQIGCFDFTVDTRSDIYSAGVVFYELLLGLSPQQNQIKEKIAPTKFIAQVYNNDSPLLIEKLKSLDDKSKTELAAKRSLSINKFTKELQHEPTWIVAKCLEQNPEKRYGSVMELKQDILNWLQKEPIQAQNNLKAYKLLKFVGRNRIAVILGSIACLLLMLTSMIAVTGYLRAEKSANDAQRATKFLVNHIQRINPEKYGDKLKTALINSLKPLGEVPTVEGTALLAEIIQHINKANFTDLSLEQLNDSFFRPMIVSVDKEFKDSPKIMGNLYQSIATALFKLGLDDQSLLPQIKAVKLKQETFGEDHVESLDSIALLSMIYLQLGQNDQALLNGEKAYEKMNQTLGERHPMTLKSARNLGNILAKSEQAEQALALLEKTRLIQESVLGKTHTETADLINTQAVALQRIGKFDDAMNLHKQALDIYMANLGHQHHKTLKAMENLANYYGLQKNLSKATELYNHALSTRKELFGEDHFETHRSQLSYAIFLMETNEMEHMLTAIGMFEETLQFYQENYGDQYPRTFETMTAFGKTYLRMGEYTKAKPYVNKALKLKLEVLGEKNDQTALSYVDSAWLTFMLGDMETHQAHYDAGIGIYNEIYGDDHPFIEAVVGFFDSIKRQKL